ncbi:MAG: GNAT family N-acetyltransferase [Pirellulaceae bacterium]|nr:GNAT family N-acetyltransferase [Pirellulaceae bacterium]
MSASPRTRRPGNSASSRSPWTRSASIRAISGPPGRLTPPAPGPRPRPNGRSPPNPTFLGKPGIYLEDLYVRPGMRGLGVGKTMLSHLANLALERDCGRLEWSVLGWNQPALKFYDSIGAEPISEWTVQRITGNSLISLAKGNSV